LLLAVARSSKAEEESNCCKLDRRFPRKGSKIVPSGTPFNRYFVYRATKALMPFRHAKIDGAQKGASGPRKGQKSTCLQQFVFTN
jgi:hypothetical protein